MRKTYHRWLICGQLIDLFLHKKDFFSKNDFLFSKWLFSRKKKTNAHGAVLLSKKKLSVKLALNMWMNKSFIPSHTPSPPSTTPTPPSKQPCVAAPMVTSDRASSVLWRYLETWLAHWAAVKGRFLRCGSKVSQWTCGMINIGKNKSIAYNRPGRNSRFLYHKIITSVTKKNFNKGTCFSG